MRQRLTGPSGRTFARRAGRRPGASRAGGRTARRTEGGTAMALFTMDGVLYLFRWIHFLAGVTWIGLLYYFNFVQGPFFAETTRARRTTRPQLVSPSGGSGGGDGHVLSGSDARGFHGPRRLLQPASNDLIRAFSGHHVPERVARDRPTEDRDRVHGRVLGAGRPTAARIRAPGLSRPDQHDVLDPISSSWAPLAPPGDRDPEQPRAVLITVLVLLLEANALLARRGHEEPSRGFGVITAGFVLFVVLLGMARADGSPRGRREARGCGPR
jgi:hypothetical protein